MAFGVPIILIIAPIAAVLSIVLSLFLAKMVIKFEDGNEAMRRVAGYIKEGAYAFLKRQYTTLAIFVGGFSIVILLLLPNAVTGIGVNWEQFLAYLLGSAASSMAGYLGMIVGVRANSRTAQAATKGLAAAFNVAFFGGAVMGLAVVGTALFGVSVLYWIFADPSVIIGFSFGASSIALFAKAGGGIYTKTADVGADLVGKGEFNLPEDDPRNPASVADNVGDNVGDIAGMGADLFDSYVASLVAAMILGASFFGSFPAADVNLFVILPLLTSSAGLLSTLLGIMLTKFQTKDNPGKALNNGTYLTTLVFAGINLLLTIIVVSVGGLSVLGIEKIWKCFIAQVMGLFAGVLIGITTDYYTDDSKKPTQNVAEASTKGHAMVILAGFSYGMESVAAPTIGIVIALAIAWSLDTVYGVANAAVGMLAIIGTIVANDAYGPITDNSRGLAEQGGLGEEVIRDCDKLDSAGNTAKAITKGFAIGAAALTVLALLYAYAEEANAAAAILGLGVLIANIDLLSGTVMIGAMLGAMMPPLFSAILVKAVEVNAERMVAEIRRQFKEIPGILDGNEKADYAKCVDIATKGAIHELVVPIIISIAGPLLTGMLFGVVALGAFLAASILTGFIFAIFMSNAGGSWDNAKKYVEDGHFGGKGTEAHKAAITGDTVGDPFKDTAGPSINTLITVMSLVSTMFIGVFLSAAFGNGLGLIGQFMI
jgi:K(+)-stimulated pyrophosphate-energized sodium pump